MNEKKLKLMANLPIQEPKSQKLTPMKIEDKLLLNWTMFGPWEVQVLKDKRGTKERPPGPEGYRRPPPPPSPVISKDPFQVI